METISTIKLIIQIILISMIVMFITIAIVLSTLNLSEKIDKKLCEWRRNEKKYKKFHK